ncbi:MAG: hypothetical protein RLZZ605_210 [Bacteroidota bacterium]|jgi:hypothetical protein
MTNQLEKTNNQITTAQKLNKSVGAVLGQKNLLGFERAFAISNAITELKELLTPEYMKPIMAMQGNKLGFRTDKDRSGGYSEEIVKNCLIEAVLLGVQPYGNQFNIIAGNMYLTKEGCGYLLSNFEGLKFTVICGLPKINDAKTSAAIDVTISWSISGSETQTTVIPTPLKMDSYTSVDALIGKATRKGRAWLLSNLIGIEVPEGDVKDAIIIESKPIETKESAEAERINLMLQDCATVKEVDELVKNNPNISSELVAARKDEIKQGKLL